MKYYMLDNNGRILSETDESGVNHSPVLLEGPPADGNIYKRVGNSWVIDQEAMDARSAVALKAQVRALALADNLPSWSQVDAAVTAIANLSDAKAFIRKLARVVYWLAKNTET
jgi:hypothetical protein